MPESVDGLELVPDREDVGQLGMGEEVDELALQPVGVLELVDHHEPETHLHGLANVSSIAQEVARGELEILEVDRRLPTFRGLVLLGKALEELLQQIAVVRGQLLEAGTLRSLARLLEGSRPGSPALECRQIDESFGRRALRHDSERLARVSPLGSGRGLVSGERSRFRTQPLDRVRKSGALAELEHELAPRGNAASRRRP